VGGWLRGAVEVGVPPFCRSGSSHHVVVHGRPTAQDNVWLRRTLSKGAVKVIRLAVVGGAGGVVIAAGGEVVEVVEVVEVELVVVEADGDGDGHGHGHGNVFQVGVAAAPAVVRLVRLHLALSATPSRWTGCWLAANGGWRMGGGEWLPALHMLVAAEREGQWLVLQWQCSGGGSNSSSATVCQTRDERLR